MKTTIPILCLLAILSCKGAPETNTNQRTTDTTIGSSDVPQQKDIEVVETFIDSSEVGNKGRNLIDLKEYRNGDSAYVVIDFYTKDKNSNWQLTQTFDAIKDPVTSCDTRINDINNDGFKDITYVSDNAGSGPNDLRTVFIYDKAANSFIYIINSPDYPNLSYNKEADCLESMKIHRTSTNSYLTLEGNELKEFISATVTTGEDGKMYNEVYFVSEGRHELVDKVEVDAEHMFNGYTNYKLIKKYKNR